MDQSRVMQNADFFRRLGHGGRHNQAELIRRASSRQINALCDVVRHILNHDIPALSYDLSHFQHQRLVLRSLISARISINRKKTILLSHLELVPRLLRDYYLARILIFTLRAREI